MDKIIDFINKETNNKYSNLLFFGGILNKKTGTMQLEFMYSNKNEKGQENLEELRVLCKKYLKNYVDKVDIKFKSNSLTITDLKQHIIDAVSNIDELSNIEFQSIKIDFVGENTLVSIPYQDGSINENLISQICETIEQKILTDLNYKIECNFQNIQNQNVDILSSRKDKILEDNLIFEEMKHSKIVELQNVEAIYGEYDFKKAFIAGSFGDENDICVVGNVKNCSIREMRQKEGEETNKEPRKYMTFELEYDNQSTRCTWFFPKNVVIQELEIDSTIAVYGKIDEYNGRKSVRVSSLAKCTFVPPKKVWRKCPTNYRYIKPEPYEFTEQINLFFEDKKTDKKYLLENSFVVYDLETTGISPENCKIIDIGAFKIVDGRIVEKFCTFVNPECEIPEEASKVNRITNALVENSPTIEMALPDFYKFCYGSTIVGYNNIGFDDLFIDKEARKQFYNFENKRDDVFNIAKDKLKGLNNYKLSTVCNAMNVQLIDAHRATNDALATAKLFIKLVEKYY